MEEAEVFLAEQQGHLSLLSTEKNSQEPKMSWAA